MKHKSTISGQWVETLWGLLQGVEMLYVRGRTRDLGCSIWSGHRFQKRQQLWAGKLVRFQSWTRGYIGEDQGMGIVMWEGAGTSQTPGSSALRGPWQAGGLYSSPLVVVPVCIPTNSVDSLFSIPSPAFIVCRLCLYWPFWPVWGGTLL